MTTKFQNQTSDDFSIVGTSAGQQDQKRTLTTQLSTVNESKKQTQKPVSRPQPRDQTPQLQIPHTQDIKKGKKATQKLSEIQQAALLPNRPVET